MSVPFNEAEALAADPFSGDFDTSTVLSDRIVTSGKHHVAACHDCAGDIAKGERHRVRTDRDDGELSTFRWCSECCRCMAEQDDEAAEERIELGDRRRAEQNLDEARTPAADRAEHEGETHGPA